MSCSSSVRSMPASGLDYMFRSSELNEPGRGSKEIWPPEWGYGRGSGFAPPEVIPEVIAGLEGLGYRAESRRLVLGENLVRVAEAVWK